MSQRDDQVYVGHMLDTANKAIEFVQGLTREDFDNNELLRLSLTHLLQVIGEAARRVSPGFRATQSLALRNSNTSFHQPQTSKSPLKLQPHDVHR